MFSNLFSCVMSKFINLNVESIDIKNLKIGSKIRLVDNDDEYIFYGYNLDKTQICYFPITTDNNISDNLRYTSIENIKVI